MREVFDKHVSDTVCKTIYYLHLPTYGNVSLNVVLSGFLCGLIALIKKNFEEPSRNVVILKWMVPYK